MLEFYLIPEHKRLKKTLSNSWLREFLLRCRCWDRKRRYLKVLVRTIFDSFSWREKPWTHRDGEFRPRNPKLCAADSPAGVSP